MMRILFIIGCLLVSKVALSTDYLLDGQVSSVGFATIKKQYVVEAAEISSLSGKLDAKGQFNLRVELQAIRTGIPIRDSRLNEIYFDSAKYPAVNIVGQFNLDELTQAGGVLKTRVSAQVTLFGQSKMITFPVTIVKSEQFLMVSSFKPVIIRASDFGIPVKNLNELAKTVGGIPISDQVPVTISLLFMAKDK